MREVTMRDVADVAAVSPAVVSRVNNGDTTLRISEETRARVLAAISDLDFQPNTAARSLRSSRSGLIAVVVQDVSNAVYAEIIRGLQSGASKANMAILLADCESVQSQSVLLHELD
jgi:LacI family transcriptional regulator